MPTPQEKLDRQLVKAAGRGDIPAIASFLEKGAQIEGQGSLWQLYATPLAHAAWHGEERAVVYLLEQGAQIDKLGVSGDTALFSAIRMKNDKCVEALLQRGARTDLQDSKGKNALEIAVAENYPAIGVIIMRHNTMREMEKNRIKSEQQEAERKKYAPPPKADPDIVIFRQKAGNRVLEEVFNFAAFERVTLVRKENNGPVETMMRENFADMTNKALLNKALEEHARRGGKVTEQDIFKGEKPKFSLPGGPS